VPAPSPRFYLPQLDGLRFIAFLLVFIHNAPSISSSKLWAAVHDYGWIGVDLFFCLSGFLITKLLVTEREQTGRINIRNFYIRRILRIWPLYFFYIILILLLPDYYLRPNTNNEALQVAGLVTFSFNVVYIYLFPFALTFFIHLWTISFEEQFYLVAPWLIHKLKAVSSKKTKETLYIIFLLGIALRVIFIYFQFKHPVIYTLPFTRFEALLGGVAIGLGLFDTVFHKIQSWLLFLLGATFNALVFILPNIYEINWDLMLSYFFVGVGMSLVVFSITRKDNQLLKRLLSNLFLTYLGKISYGLYVFHIISIRLAFQLFEAIQNTEGRSLEELNTLVFIAGLIITVVLSAASYQFIEKPFLKLKEKFGVVQSHPI
jgi:peptidoglycan/LPS O-acetylase OafA/YrhL